MTSKERYQWYKANGICVSCHSQQATQGIMCERCRQKRKEYSRTYDRERYEMYASHGICVRCKQEKTESGSVFCLVCKMDRRVESYVPLEGEKKRKKAEASLSHYYRLKEQGLCVQCGKRKTNGAVRCIECATKQRKHKNQRNHELGILPRVLMGNGDYCSWCGKPVENTGDKLCKRCLENSLRTIQIAFEHRQRDNEFARANDAFWAELKSKKRG